MSKRILRWACIPGAIVSIYFGLQAFGPHADVVVASDTTFITKPLASSDGAPDYILALLDAQREGVEADNNAAAQLWQIVGVARYNPAHFDALRRELGLIDLTKIDPLVFVDAPTVRDALSEWLAQNASAHGGDDASQVIAAASSRPWNSAEFPPLATWLAANRQQLDAAVAAAALPKFFSPPPNALLDATVAGIDMMLPHVDLVTRTAKSLSVRAMYEIAAQHYDDAWQDCRACLQLADHLARGSLVERAEASRLQLGALDIAFFLINAEGLPEGLISQIVDELGDERQGIEMVSAFDGVDRLIMLDATLRLTIDRFGGIDSDSIGIESRSFVSLDPNVPLRMVNAMFDRIVAALKLQDRGQRDIAFDAIEAELAAMSDRIAEGDRTGMLNRNNRSARVGEIVLAHLVPSFRDAAAKAELSKASLTLVRIAAALALHQHRTGAYPDSLAELAPRIIEHIPTHAYLSAKIQYELNGDGYILYSQMPSTDGDRIREIAFDSDQPSINADDSDIVIRVPQPPVAGRGAAGRALSKDKVKAHSDLPDGE